MKMLNTRLPDEIHAALEAIAEQDRRSLNTMIIVLIEQEQKRRRRADTGEQQ
jgi:predicted HicB family RNase H-like nuclease